MSFQERFKGKTSQISKDLVASITETSDKMKVDFNNMKPCDVFEICRSYTPTVKSEMGGPTRSSKEKISFNTTDKGIFGKQVKSQSQKLINNNDQLNTLGNEHHQSIFSTLQNNFDNNDTISDMISPATVKKSLVMKQIEKQRYPDSPTIFKMGNPQNLMTENTQASPLILEKSNSVFQPKIILQNPQQILQARLAKERSQSNNFQRVGSFLTKQQSQQAEPQAKEKGGVEVITHKSSTPQFSAKKMQTEEGENFSKNMSQIEPISLNKSSINSTRQKNIERNLISSNRSVIKQMTENHGYSAQIMPEGVMYTIENEKAQSNSPKKLSNTLPIYNQKLSLQVNQVQQEEYFPQSSNSNWDMTNSLQLNQMSQQNPIPRKIKSHINFYEGSNNKILPTEGSHQENLGQFINGLNRNSYSVSSTFLNSNQNNNSKILQSQQLWMNSQLNQILPTDSLQNQINQIQMKREEEEALIQYRNSFNYRVKNNNNNKAGLGNNSPALSAQGFDSPSVIYKRQNENFQQLSEEVNNNQYSGQNLSHQNSINNTNNNTPSNQQHILRQKSYSSQAYPLNLQQKILMNIK